jgi:long-chain fatty acid transport protein
MTFRIVSLPLLGVGWLTLAAMTPACAGGFAQGTADTDVLFADGDFAVRSSVQW